MQGNILALFIYDIRYNHNIIYNLINTRTETWYAGTNSSNQHYVGKSTEGSNSINVTTNTGETGGFGY